MKTKFGENGLSHIFNRLFLIIYITIFSSSCSFYLFSIHPQPHLGTGTMVVRYGSYIYRIGGENLHGDVRSTVMMAEISLDAEGKPNPLNWTETAPLPGPRAFGAAFAAGHLIYVLGGEGENGPTSTVYTTKINEDGTLGWGASRFWETSSMPLDAPRSHMSWILHDGRVFLIGGKKGSLIDDSIIHARLYESTGWPGRWYESPARLPEAVSDSGAAVVNGKLEIAGGMKPSHNASNTVVSFALGSDALLSDMRQVSMPKALISPMCIPDGDSYIIAGGYDSSFSQSTNVYRHKNGTWNIESASIDAEGPSYAIGNGTIWYPQHMPDESMQGVGKASGIITTPDRIIVALGSGMVPTKSKVKLKPEPGTKVWYRNDTSPITGSSTAGDKSWDEETWDADVSSGTTYPNIIAVSKTLSLRSYNSGGVGSEQIILQYAVRTSNFFTWISGNFPLKNEGATLDSASVSDNLFNPSSTGYTSVWGRILLSRKTNLELIFADYDTQGGSASYSGRIKLTLYEDDLYSEVPDINGLPVRACTTTSTQQPILLSLNPGKYYLQIIDVDGQKGRTFGIAFRQR